MTVTHQGHVCHVVPYPISIEWPPRWLATQSPTIADRARGGARALRHRPRTCVSASASSAGTSPRASSSASWRSRRCSTSTRSGAAAITLLQVAAPSRSQLPAYQALQQHTLAEVERINAKFGTDGWQPDRADRRAPGAGAGLRAVPRGGLLPGQQPARRHEPGGQGIRRRPRRRGRRADPEHVRGRLARTGRSAARQSVRRRRDGGRDRAPRSRCRATSGASACS